MRGGGCVVLHDIRYPVSHDDMPHGVRCDFNLCDSSPNRCTGTRWPPHNESRQQEDRTYYSTCCTHVLYNERHFFFLSYINSLIASRLSLLLSVVYGAFWLVILDLFCYLLWRPAEDERAYNLWARPTCLWLPPKVRDSLQLRVVEWP